MANEYDEEVVSGNIDNTPANVVQGQYGTVVVKNPYAPVAGYEDSVEVKDRPALGTFDPLAIRQEKIANKMAEQEAIQNGTVEDIRSYYPDQGHADMVIGNKWKNQLEYYNHLKSIGYTDDSREMGNALHDYTQSQSSKIQNRWNSIYNSAREIKGMNQDEASAYADKMIAKDENDVLDSGFKAWLPKYMRSQGDTKTADALENMNMDVYTATDIMDTYDEAKNNNLLVKPRIEYVKRKDGSVAKKLVLDRFDAMGNKVEDMRKINTNPAKLGEVMTQFNKTFFSGLPQAELEGVLSDTSPSGFRNGARAYAENIVRKIAVDNKVSEQGVWQLLKMASKNQDMNDDQYKDMLVEQLKPMVEANREKSLTDAVMVDKSYRDLYTQVTANLLDDKIGMAVPTSGKMDVKAKARRAMMYRDNALAEGVPEDQMNNYMRERLIDEIVQATPSPDDDKNQYRRQLAGQVIDSNGVVTAMEAEANAVRHEEALKRVAKEQADAEKIARAQGKEAKAIDMAEMKDGTTFINAIDDNDMRDIVQYAKKDKNGNVDEGLFSALGMEYNARDKRVVIKPTVKNTDMFKVRQLEDERINQTRNMNRGELVIDVDDKRNITPKGYLQLYNLYKSGTGASQEQLDSFGVILRNPDNMRNFIKQYASEGIDFKDLKQTVFSESKLRNPKMIVDANIAKTTNEKKMEYYKTIVGEKQIGKKDASYLKLVELYPQSIKEFSETGGAGLPVSVGGKEEILGDYLDKIMKKGRVYDTGDDFSELPLQVQGLFTPALKKVYDDKASWNMKRLAVALALMSNIGK